MFDYFVFSFFFAKCLTLFLSFLFWWWCSISFLLLIVVISLNFRCSRIFMICGQRSLTTKQTELLRGGICFITIVIIICITIMGVNRREKSLSHSFLHFKRWILNSNRGLATLITSLLGSEDWVTDLDKLKGLKQFSKVKSVQARFAAVKHNNKVVTQLAFCIIFFFLMIVL